MRSHTYHNNLFIRFVDFNLEYESFCRCRAANQGISRSLSYLPSPKIAELMTFGHGPTQAKLQWMDSFSNWQYLLDHQVDKKDGRLPMALLYDNLVFIDPLFFALLSIRNPFDGLRRGNITH